MSIVNFPFTNAHFSTIYPSLIHRPKEISYERIKFSYRDGDSGFIDLGIQSKSRPNLLLLHGLEGSSRASYMQRAVRYFSTKFNCFAVNHRGCAGVPNNKLNSYHSGSVEDIEDALYFLMKLLDFNEFFIIGFSLGGNIALKFTAQSELTKNLVATAAVSVPCHLESSALALAQFKNKVYMLRFLRKLGAKMRYKKIQFPDAPIDWQKVLQAKNFMEFDEAYTAPAHGFLSAKDYYNKVSSLYALKDLQKPALLINAKNDPFLTAKCFPIAPEINNPHFYYHYPKYGGHAGFYLNWREEQQNLWMQIDQFFAMKNKTIHGSSANK